jgi:two-component system, NarL family, invasion response regulator UvrY
MTIPVIVVDDQPAFRRAARTVLGRLVNFELVGEATSGEDAVALCDELQPALVLMDINLPGIDGIEATRQIVARRADTAVVLVSTYRAEELPEGAATCGAIAYLHKERLRPPVLEQLWTERNTPFTF